MLVTTISPPGAEPSEPRSTAAPRRAAWIPALVGLVSLLYYRLVIHIRDGSMAAVTLSSIAYLVLTLLFTVTVARALRTTRAQVISLLAALMVAIPAILLPMLIRFAAIPTGLLIAAAHLYVAVHRVAGLDGLILLWLAASLGALLAGLVREMKVLLPMAVALALVDLYTVFGGGVVTQAVSGHSTMAQHAMQALTVKLPTAAHTRGAAPIPLAAGFADFLFIDLFFACFAKFDIPSRRTFIALCVALLLYMAIIVVWPQPVALPALVPIGLVVVGMNLRWFRYTRSEAFALLYAGLLLVGILSFLAVRARH